MTNTEIRKAIKLTKVRMWEVADRLGIADSAFSKKLRYELSDDERAQILRIIDEIAAKKCEVNANA